MSKSDFIEITLRHGYSPMNLLHTFRTPFTKNTSERLLLKMKLENSDFTYEKYETFQNQN